MAYKLACVCRDELPALATTTTPDDAPEAALEPSSSAGAASTDRGTDALGPFPPAMFGGQRLLRCALAQVAERQGRPAAECSIDLGAFGAWARGSLPFLATCLAAFLADVVLGQRGGEQQKVINLL